MWPHFNRLGNFVSHQWSNFYRLQGKAMFSQASVIWSGGWWVYDVTSGPMVHHRECSPSHSPLQDMCVVHPMVYTVRYGPSWRWSIPGLSHGLSQGVRQTPWRQTPLWTETSLTLDRLPQKEHGTRQEVTSYTHSPWKEHGTRQEVTSYTHSPWKEHGTRQEVTSYTHSPWKEHGTRQEVTSYTHTLYWPLVVATAVVGAHPTWMHSCFYIVWHKQLFQLFQNLKLLEWSQF